MSTELWFPSVDARNAVMAVAAWSRTEGASGLHTEIMDLRHGDGYKLDLMFTRLSSPGASGTFRLSAGLTARLNTRLVNGLGSQQCPSTGRVSGMLDLAALRYLIGTTISMTGCTVHFANGRAMPIISDILRPPDSATTRTLDR